MVFEIYTQEIAFEIYIILLQHHTFSCVPHYSESTNLLWCYVSSQGFECTLGQITAAKTTCTETSWVLTWKEVSHFSYFQNQKWRSLF